MQGITRSIVTAAAVASMVLGCGSKDRAVGPEPAAPGAAIGMQSLEVAAGFDFRTSRAVEVNIRVLSPQGDPLPRVRVDVRGPAAVGAPIIASGASDATGAFVRNLAVPVHYAELEVEVTYIGIPGQATVPITAGLATHTFGGPPAASVSHGPSPSPKVAVAPGDFTAMGRWNHRGVPKYLEESGDVIDAEFLEDVNASLPEGRPVPESNPEYLAEGAVSNIGLQQEADVWVTFVHEGAGFRNAMGYYTHPRGKAPSSLAEIEELTIVFPNVSYAGSGGGLHSGDKVYLGLFPAGTEIGWFLVADGWLGSGVYERRHTVYSEPGLNPEPEAALRQHTVLLNDAGRELILMGVEDLRRDEGSDNDFNDAVFYVTATPFSAVVTEGMEDVREATDTDGDGILDYYEDYPLDGARAYNSYYPSAEGQATLAYEDLWPGRGDYDFNDLVVDYRFTEVTNADNEVVDILGDFTVRAIGANYANALAVALPFSAGAVADVQGASLSAPWLSTGPGNLEAGQSQAVAIVFDSADEVLGRTPGQFANTELAEPAVSPQTVSLTVTLATPMALSAPPPYNPFIIVNGDRGREVHLPGHEPTDLARADLFGTGDDASRGGGYYKTATHLPWALNLAGGWQYPLERVPIVEAYPRFAAWAESGGALYPDWYLGEAGNRVSELTYPSP